MSLYNIGDSYVVEDRNHRVSVTHYQGMEMIDAENRGTPHPDTRGFAENTGAEDGIMLLVERATKKEVRDGDARPILPDATPRSREGQKSGASRGLGDAGSQRSDDVTLCGASPLKCV